MGVFVQGIVQSLAAKHFPFRKVRQYGVPSPYEMSGVSRYRSDAAKVSLWATVVDERGGTWQVWMGKVSGRAGISCDRQKTELVQAHSHLIGKNIAFRVSRGKGFFSGEITCERA